MYSASPPLQHYPSGIDRRRTSNNVEPQQQPQQAWLQPTLLQQQQPQDPGMNYMVHHGYPVVPKPPTSIPNSHSPHYHQQQYPHHPPSLNNKQQQGNRAVMPSKRAAQNRAAQKKFRQRRDCYVKDLERKSKEMDQWQKDRDSVMDENRRLKSLVHQLQSRISSLTGEPIPASTLPSLQDDQQSRNSLPPPSSPPPISSPSSPPRPTLGETSTSSEHQPSLSPAITASIPPATMNVRSSPSPPPPMTQQTSNLSSSSHRPSHPYSSSSSASSPTHPATPSHSFLPIPLRPHSFVPSKEDDVPSPSPPPPPNSSSPSVPLTVVAPAGQVASTSSQTTAPISLPPVDNPQVFDLDLDPFFDDDFGFPRMDDQLDFVGHSNNSGQVLDDLFAMLQTRQRPQIPLQPTNDDSQIPPYYMMDITGHSSTSPL